MPNFLQNDIYAAFDSDIDTEMLMDQVGVEIGVVRGNSKHWLTLDFDKADVLRLANCV